MAEFAEGNIRIRGKRENLIRFLREELVPIAPGEDGKYENRPIMVEENCGGWSIILKRDWDTYAEVYFKGANRQYILMDECEVELDMNEGKNQNQDQVIWIDGYNGVWNADREFFRQKAMKHKVDIRIFVWNQGDAWKSVATWYRDGKTDESTRKFADWMWDSPVIYFEGVMM